MHTLPDLPYAYNALEPHIDEATMKLHHTKHHQTYVDKLNAALEPYPELQNTSLTDLIKSLESLPESIKTAIKNHGGGHANHSLFWQTLSSNAPKTPTGTFATALNAAFGSFDALKQKMSEAAINHFGSGWAWLSVAPQSTGTGVSPYAPTLSIYSLPNQDSPIGQGHIPLFGIDVWEHAYYLKYQNRRADYVNALWNVINWPHIETLYEAAIK